MNEQEWVRRVIRELDASLDALPPAVNERLSAARAAAVKRVNAPGLATAYGGRLPAGAWLRPRILAPVLMLVLALTLWSSYRDQAQQPAAEVAALDSELLTDDLPVVAYLDQGFEIWLYHHGSAQR